MKTLKRVTKNIKKDIMAYAWKLARIEAEETNCSPRECIGWAEYYGDIEHSSYISGYHCPMIWAF